jgi:hypothetical protein
MIKKYGWNDLLYNISMASVCNIEQTRFYILSGFTFLMLLYITWETHLYLEEVKSVPRHLLKMPKDLTSDAWYAHPTGEKQFMLGKWGFGDSGVDTAEETMNGLDHRVLGKYMDTSMEATGIGADGNVPMAGYGAV